MKIEEGDSDPAPSPNPPRRAAAADSRTVSAPSPNAPTTPRHAAASVSWTGPAPSPDASTTPRRAAASDAPPSTPVATSPIRIGSLPCSISCHRAVTFSRFGLVMTRISSLAHEIHAFLSLYGREATYILRAAELSEKIGTFFGHVSHLLGHCGREINNIDAALNQNPNSGLLINGANLGNNEGANDNEGYAVEAAEVAVAVDAGKGSSSGDGSESGKENVENYQDAEPTGASCPPVENGSVDDLAGPVDMRSRSPELKNPSHQLADAGIMKRMVSSADDVAVIINEDLQSSGIPIIIDVPENISLRAARAIHKFISNHGVDNILRGTSLTSKLQQAARVEQELYCMKAQHGTKRKELESIEARIKQLEHTLSEEFPSQDYNPNDEGQPSKRPRV